MEKSYQQREERLREVAGISGITRSTFKPVIGHYIVRVIAVLNIADLILGTYSTAYYRFSEAHLGKTIMVWYLLSSFALPLYVFGEAVILRKVRRDYKEILIDGIFATRYFIRSSVLGGQVVSEMTPNSNWHQSFVFAGNQLLAVQTGAGSARYVAFKHQSPSGSTQWDSDPAGTKNNSVELDPLQVQMAGTFTADDNSCDRQENIPNIFQKFGDANLLDRGCTVDGVEERCAYALHLLNSNAGVLCPNNNCGPRVVGDRLKRVDFSRSDFRSYGLGIFGMSRDWGRDLGFIGQKYDGSTGNWIDVLGTDSNSDMIFFVLPQNSGFDLDGITRLVNQALSNSDCAGFMSRVLNTASSKSNPVLDGGNASKVFTDFLNQKHGGLTREKPEGSLGYGSPTGRIAKGNAKIFLIGGVANQTVTDAIGVIGELAHLAGSKGSYTDQLLATIVHDIPEYAAMSSMKTPHSNVFDPNYERRDEAAKNPNAGGWSSYFHDIQRKKCHVGN